MAKRIPFQRPIEIIAVTALMAGLAALAFRLWHRFAEMLPEKPLVAGTLAGLVIFGYVAADFASGFVHFLGDTFFKETTPIIGPAFIKPFRDHHVHPEWITQHDFFEVNANNSIVSLPFAALAFLIVPTHPYVAAFLLFFLLGILGTNQFHKWAHQSNPSRLARVLQRMRLVLTPTHHKLHHTAPYESDFCITTGWLNPLLGRLGFFSFARRVLGRLFPLHD